MAELIYRDCANASLRSGLLAGVSLLSLIVWSPTFSASASEADDSDKPLVWIELGGQVEKADAGQAILAPPFFEQASPDDVDAMTRGQRPSRYDIGGEGRISIVPSGSDWTFAASVRYGRANSTRHVHHESKGLAPQYFTLGGNPFIQYSPLVRMFGDAQSVNRDSHLILDFTAGKDVGLGLFGAHSTSVISAGVRFAQFTSKTDLTLHARPVNSVSSKYNPGSYHVYLLHRRTYTAVLHAERNAHAIGPTVSWDASVPLARSDNGNALLFDWGINAAILFGRQRTLASHHTSGAYYTGLASGTKISSYSHHPADKGRSKSVTIPNVGGFAGLSLKISNVRVSMGYRADFYFNAIDNGIDARHEQDEKFYGPFATVSVGLGG